MDYFANRTYERFNGFLFNVSYSFFKTYERHYNFFSLRRLLLSIRLINNWTLCRTIQGVIVLVN